MKFKTFALIVGIVVNIILLFTLTGSVFELASSPLDYSLWIALAISLFVVGIEVFVVYPLFRNMFKYGDF